MTPEELVSVSHQHALELPATSRDQPFGEGWDAYRVRGKIFMIRAHPHFNPARTQMIILKAIPDEGVSLRQQYDEITPGYHMNKTHWNSVVAGPGISPELVKDLITDSYLCVVDKLPKAKQPVDPFNHRLTQFL
ncbi:MmcQ/YjbR family DNA-binding protein [Corynebacterium sp. zg254]|uniref:MmcQ/YjbR family DNA-binding protein n=1 Tax=Corynebacterium sp. zg254 TaxID=2656645 RepID=UPI002151A8B8|nr:MmcQ/YjbR family DNA-binding protein [Corynebacterium sp. zg254]MCR5914869.1 MmcQ/YjbR family DNA-binding protein [Corynebacterium sp. zg254]